ncbi:hypothetical protein M231_00349 [Tremella mesenterica]|uniref:Uncharacterized protein n=1 Tax=Tremella mesenterica TaxID=5217 RepID=A0A4Q1BW25_TREME|nr:uncharacterized protein TREMEDRAFT_63501 [Tremella mesenterica DSM 1558]EIW68329.1 hypothetical protein TREMEDRAFT_63501 [Tremella mesenterica DSM 1558]RXK42359.1 hypothetical protein M231_00349 [Tremella mesenterica]
MGSCISSPDKGGQKLGSAPPTPSPTPAAGRAAAPVSNNRPTRSGPPPQVLGGNGTEGDPREVARRAAEMRLDKERNKGVNSSNPSAGKLSRQLEATRKAPSQPPPNERLMDAGRWN